MRKFLLPLLILACTPAEEPLPVQTTEVDYHDLPGHNQCLPAGEIMDDETCLAVIEADGRLPGESFDKSGVVAESPDPRHDDPDLQQLYDDIRRCTCSCCHQSTLGGPGAFFWDLDFEPMWIDSASVWSLQVMVGFVESENQLLPHEDRDWLQTVIQTEIDRRDYE